jgi:hypothetical protein
VAVWCGVATEYFAGRYSMQMRPRHPSISVVVVVLAGQFVEKVPIFKQEAF